NHIAAVVGLDHDAHYRHSISTYSAMRRPIAFSEGAPHAQRLKVILNWIDALQSNAPTMLDHNSPLAWHDFEILNVDPYSLAIDNHGATIFCIRLAHLR